jgi:hypothetical protein
VWTWWQGIFEIVDHLCHEGVLGIWRREDDHVPFAALVERPLDARDDVRHVTEAEGGFILNHADFEVLVGVVFDVLALDRRRLATGLDVAELEELGHLVAEHVRHAFVSWQWNWAF